MTLAGLFAGCALSRVDGRGRLQLPPFVLNALARRGDARRLLLAPHECDPCIAGRDPDGASELAGELRRMRLRDESEGLEPAGHHRRARRAFAAAEPVEIDSRGRIPLPPLVRKRGGIGELALCVGTGAGFEIWSPEAAAGDSELGDLAAMLAELAGAEGGGSV